MIVADALSRAPFCDEKEQEKEWFMGTDLLADEVYVSECVTERRVTDFTYTENSDRTKRKILEAARRCEEYQAALRAVSEGWNFSDRDSCGEYWDVREDIFESEGMLYFEGRVIIPKNLRQKYLRALHCGHVGIRATKSRAQGIWWPRWEKDIIEFVKGCACCQVHGQKQQKEPMQSFEVPAAPGLVVASDHFSIGGRVFVLFTDVFSMWTEFFKVPSTAGKHLLRALRCFMARNGVPRVLMADQGSAYTGSELKEFCEKMEIRLTVNSAKHSQGNAFAEAAVKRVKKWIKKCKDEDDLCMAILRWHQTPLADGRPSPAEIHLGRNVRDGLSWKVEQVQVDWKDVRHWRESRNRMAKEFYDRTAKPMKELEPGQQIYVWNGQDRKWESGRVLKKLDRPRSYLLKTDTGSMIEQNRKDIKPNESWHSFHDGHYNVSSFQDCSGWPVPAADDDGRTGGTTTGPRSATHGGNRSGAAAVRGGRGGDDGRAGSGLVASDDGRGDGDRAGTGDPERGDDGEPVHGDASRRAAGQFSRSAGRSPQVTVEEEEDHAEDTGGQEPVEEEVVSRKRRERRLPKKYDDFVLY
jgi:hypothetical protein